MKMPQEYSLNNVVLNFVLNIQNCMLSWTVLSKCTRFSITGSFYVVCQYYEEHYQSKQPIPATHLGELMRLTLKENSFKFNAFNAFLQTHGIAMGIKMAVAFAVIFMAHIETQLLALAHKNLSSGRDLSMTFFQCGPWPKKNLISQIHSTLRSNSCTKCHQKKLFPWFSKDRASLTTKLLIFKHIRSPQKRFNIRISLQVTLSVIRMVLLKKKFCVYWEQTRLKKFSSCES